MDLIRAYACGLLPDTDVIGEIEPEPISLAIYNEFINNINGPGKGQTYGAIRASVWMTREPREEPIISARRLCQRLLAYYEKQQERV